MTWIPKKEGKKPITKADFETAAKLMNRIGMTALQTLPIGIIEDPKLKQAVSEIHNHAKGYFSGRTDDEMHTLNVVLCALWAESLLNKLQEQLGLILDGKE